MAELNDRMDWEAQVSKEVAKLLRRQMGRLLELLGDPPDLNNVPESFWVANGEELQAALAAYFQQIYLASAEQILSGQPIGVDWTLVNSDAISWAQSYSFELIRGITDTTRQAVSNAVQAFFGEQQTLADLKDSLSGIFGPIRAEMIASTEVTRAAVQGELGIVDELGRMGVQMRAVWYTQVDERVCPICGPYQAQSREVWGFSYPDGPPAHPRCRCWLNHEFMGVAVG